MEHRGQIVEKAIKKSGYSLTKLAERLDISRGTLYNRFTEKNLSYRFILEIGNIIYYDFTHDFPRMRKEVNFASAMESKKEKKEVEQRGIEEKYTQLLEKHNKLLEIILKEANKIQFPVLSQEIQNFLNQES